MLVVVLIVICCLLFIITHVLLCVGGFSFLLLFVFLFLSFFGFYCHLLFFFLFFFGFFFFKQKTAYEWRIIDWSSDVCSSDLASPASDGVPSAAPVRPPTVRDAATAAAVIDLRMVVSFSLHPRRSGATRAPCKPRLGEPWERPENLPSARMSSAGSQVLPRFRCHAGGQEEPCPPTAPLASSSSTTRTTSRSCSTRRCVTSATRCTWPSPGGRPWPWSARSTPPSCCST